MHELNTYSKNDKSDEILQTTYIISELTQLNTTKQSFYVITTSFLRFCDSFPPASIKNIPKTRNTFCGTWYLPHSRVHKSIAELCSNFGDSAISKGQIAYFSLRMCETFIILLPVKNLTSSCSPTPISYMMQEFWRFGHKYGPNCIFFIAHARLRETPIILLLVNNLTSLSCSLTPISYNLREFWRYVNI